MRSQFRAVWLTILFSIGVHSRPLDNFPSGSSFGIPGANATYDYVVVGGGTAGLTIASRLIDQKAGSVAVIEAGTFYELTNGNNSQVPANAPVYAGKSVTDWQPLADWGYITTPQIGADNITMHYPRGKMLSGCSGRNFLIYHRSTVGAFQNWADQVNDQSYTFPKLLPYFEKSINFTPPNNDLRFRNATPSYSNSSLGSRYGTVGVTFPNWAYAFPSWATKAFTQMGIKLLAEGFLNGKLLGQAYAMFTIDATTMFRSSSETAFLQQILALDTPEFALYPLTMGKRILFDGNKTATGVVVDSDGATYTLSARKEVILSSGFIGSPQLLQVSGLGPSALLQSLDIPVVADLPGVGANMQDHLVFGISQGINAVTASSLGDPAFLAEQKALFDTKAQGLLTSVGADLVSWEKLPNSTRSSFSNSTLSYLNTFPADWPEVEYVAFSAYFGNGFTITGEDPQNGIPYATMGIALHTPRSRGSVTITSPDTSIHPLIDPGFLSDPADVDVVVGGFKRARQFWAQSSLTPLKIGSEAYPGANVTNDDAAIAASIRKSFQTEYHGSCTCAMGKEGDNMAVVDTQGRVFGVDGLRVVDASIFPLLPPGHPVSLVYALAEKIACNISGNC